MPDLRTRSGITRPPESILTERLIIRRWVPADAQALSGALETSIEHLKPWIPQRVAEPATVDQLEARLTGFSGEFDAGREWSYAVMLRAAGTLLGGVSLHPRNQDGRVAFAEADRIEIGYWLRTGLTGNGYATEAARAILDVATTLPGMTRVEIRCSIHNVPSAAIPRRLGFQLAESRDGDQQSPDAEGDAMMLWQLPLPR